MALPNSNISTSLVGTTLGTSTRDVGSLCRHPNINKWSKWKPVRLNKVAGLTEADMQSANYGLNIPIATSPQNLRSLVVNEPLQWTYLRPTGGSSFPYRLGDFRNYDHSAVAAVAGTYATERVVLQGPLSLQRVHGNIFMSTGSDTELSYYDLIANYPYLGISIFTKDGMMTEVHVAPEPYMNNVSLPVNHMSPGFFDTLMFLTNSGRTGYAAINNSGLRGLGIVSGDPGSGGGSPGTGGVYLSLTAEWVNIRQTPYPPTADLKVTANVRNYWSTDTVYLINANMYLRYHYNEWNTLPYEDGERYRSFGEVAVPPTDSSGQDIVYTFTNLDYRKAGSYQVWWNSGGIYPLFDGTAAPIEMD